MAAFILVHDITTETTRRVNVDQIVDYVPRLAGTVITMATTDSGEAHRILALNEATEIDALIELTGGSVLSGHQSAIGVQ